MTLLSELGEESPGTEGRPGVVGGAACIIRTRIPVGLLEQAGRLGTSDADLLKAYPTLRAEDLANAWAYLNKKSLQTKATSRSNVYAASFAYLITGTVIVFRLAWAGLGNAFGVTPVATARGSVTAQR